jgi:hypothetical protein
MLALVLLSGHRVGGKVRDALNQGPSHQSWDANFFRCQLPAQEVELLPESPPWAE